MVENGERCTPGGTCPAETAHLMVGAHLPQRLPFLFAAQRLVRASSHPETRKLLGNKD